MTRRFWVGAVVTAVALVLTGCAGTPESTSTLEMMPSPTQSAEPAGSRQNPIPYGGSYTFVDIGEMAGPAWTVTIDEPRDMSTEILAAAVALFGEENEGFLAPSRPAPGHVFMGVSGTVERLQDAPASPGADLDTGLITADGQTYEGLQFGVSAPEGELLNIPEMSGPATAQFGDVQEVSEGSVVQQVVVVMSNTGERVYFGEPSTAVEVEAAPVAPADPESAFLELLRTSVPSLADPIANNPREVFIDWGYWQCQQVQERGAEALWEGLRIALQAGGTPQDRAQGFSEEMGVTVVAAETLCPDILPPVQQFITEVEQLFGGSE